MKMQEMREKTDAELERMLTELRSSLQEKRFQVASRQLTSVREIRDEKRTVARILTLQRERQNKSDA